MRDLIVNLLKTLVPADIKIDVAVPPEEKMGHYSTNVAFALAKREGRTPIAAAEELVKRISSAEDIGWLLKAEAVPPGFVNFFLTPSALSKALKEVLRKQYEFGRGLKKKETVVVEYSSPNIAKPLGVHHLRSTIIGQAIVNLLRFAGYKAVSLSFPGDWGTQFGLLIAGYKRWGDPKKIKENPIDEMLNLYVRFSQAAKENPGLLDEGRAEFKKLEQGDKTNKKLWKWFLAESLRDFERVYKLLGVKIENTIGESYYEPELKPLIEDALKRGVAVKGKDGSVVIQIPGSTTPEIIQKSDGATIYTTREIAAIRHRLKKWKADKIIYVAANQQTFHLEQVFRTAEILGYAKPGQLEHVKFGMMLGLGGKKFATREGRLIPLEDVLHEAIERSRKLVDNVNPAFPENKKKEIAGIVGVGAVKFFDLVQNRMSDIVFDWDKMLNLKGASAPYLQYTYARLRSILRKASGVKRQVSGGLSLKEESELNILGYLIHFPEAVEDAALRYEPNHIAEYLLKLTEKANHFYESLPVLKAEKGLREARLVLIQAVTIVIKNGLNLLGIEAPERM